MRRLRTPALVLFFIFSIWTLCLVVAGGIDAIGVRLLDRAVAWLGERGVRVYALLEPWEVPQFERQFDGQRAAADLSRRAVFFYRGVNAIGLYDLIPGATLAPRDIVANDPAALRAVPPAPPPALDAAMKR
jgi:hypothetical protein